MTEKGLFKPAEADIPYQLPDGREILLTADEFSLLDSIQHLEKPTSLNKLSAKLTGDKYNHPRPRAQDALYGLKRKFPANIATVTKGKDAGFIFWHQEEPTQQS